MEIQTIKTLRLLLLLGIIAGLGGEARAEETNVWPFWVGKTKDLPGDQVEGWQSVGPFVFHQKLAEDPPQQAGGLRPLYVQKNDPARTTIDGYFLYPLFSYHATPHGSHWSLFQLINHSSYAGRYANGGDETRDRGFDLWPFYFSRQTGTPETSYRALFPIAGAVKNRFGEDRFSWAIFPLYGRFEKNNVVTTTAPWPLIKVLQGEGNHGFEFWPLFGWREKAGAYHERFWLWPLFYYDEHALWKPTPAVKIGVLPFYTRESSESSINENYLYPFFGYTDRTAPKRYHEVRYLWPLFVQGRGEDRYLNRWGPFYTHSISPKGTDKTWILWPLWKHQTWTDAGLAQTKNQFLFWLYHSTVQRSVRNPALPTAHKTHLWPLFTVWDNGAGRKQVQALSPFAVLFPSNQPIQLAYEPLFALYRYDREAPGVVRHTALWNFISYRRQPGAREFHLGPLFSTESGAESGRIALGCGLLGLKREAPGNRWRFFAFEFKRRAAKAATAQP